jgi:hypothetical protein
MGMPSLDRSTFLRQRPRTTILQIWMPRAQNLDSLGGPGPGKAGIFDFSPALTRLSRGGFRGCRKTQYVVIPRRAARRGISLFQRFKHREIPHFVRNDNQWHFFRNLFSR